nr:class I SAM-dependent methyltransferase [Rhizobium halophytocola]
MAFYARQAEAYSRRKRLPAEARLEGFLARLPDGGDILELGCGAGADSDVMRQRGYRIRPTDGSAEMAALASQHLGMPVATLLFHELDEIARFDGIWANACLLHVPRSGLPDVLQRIHRALRPGGVFFASYKEGAGEGQDGLGRYYNYPSRDDLHAFYAAFHWQAVDISAAKGSGYDDRPTDWLYVTAVKPA